MGKAIPKKKRHTCESGYPEIYRLHDVEGDWIPACAGMTVLLGMMLFCGMPVDECCPI